MTDLREAEAEARKAVLTAHYHSQRVPLLDAYADAVRATEAARYVNECPHCGGHLLFVEPTDFTCESCGDTWTLKREPLFPDETMVEQVAEAIAASGRDPQANRYWVTLSEQERQRHRTAARAALAVIADA